MPKKDGFLYFLFFRGFNFQEGHASIIFKILSTILVKELFQKDHSHF